MKKLDLGFIIVASIISVFVVCSTGFYINNKIAKDNLVHTDEECSPNKLQMDCLKDCGCGWCSHDEQGNVGCYSSSTEYCVASNLNTTHSEECELEKFAIEQAFYIAGYVTITSWSMFFVVYCVIFIVYCKCVRCLCCL